MAKIGQLGREKINKQRDSKVIIRTETKKIQAEDIQKEECKEQDDEKDYCTLGIKKKKKRDIERIH